MKARPQNPFALPTAADRLALLERLQAGASIWAPSRSDPRYRPIIKPVQGDKRPDGKAAARRRKQMLRDQQAQLARGFEKLDEMRDEYGPARIEHAVDGDAGPVSDVVAEACGLKP
jgi:hypothetical protein